MCWGSANGMVQHSVQKNSRFQTRFFVANWGKTGILLIDYACMNYTLTHPAQSEWFKKYLSILSMYLTLYTRGIWPMDRATFYVSYRRNMECQTIVVIKRNSWDYGKIIRLKGEDTTVHLTQNWIQITGTDLLERWVKVTELFSMGHSTANVCLWIFNVCVLDSIYLSATGVAEIAKSTNLKEYILTMGFQHSLFVAFLPSLTCKRRTTLIHIKITPGYLLRRTNLSFS